MTSGVIITLLILVTALCGAAALAVIVRRHIHLWLLPWLKQRLLDMAGRCSAPAERHIIIAVCDHFDFGSAGEYREGEEGVLDRWEEEFPPLAERHRDSRGVNLKHTWFFPPHYHRGDYLERLVKLSARGYGEVEMHLHHDHIPPWPDTSETLRKKIRDCVEEYAKYGVFCLPDGSRTFGFIHGDWALDNSRSGKYCGVNDEISILAEEGCYADFTFPSLHEAQPKKINAIYYVTDDPARPKSYDQGVDVAVGGRKTGDLMLIQGPLGLRRKRKYGIPFFPAIESAELEERNGPSMERLRTWVQANVHVKGRPEWIFVKLHTHGAMLQNVDYNIGQAADDFFSELEATFNTPEAGFIHYVTAREMYNIIKAAEAGERGNPGDYRDYAIAPYVYLPEKYRT